jgi:anthranilate 1,2-dioxygenase ferredoxin component
VSDVWHEVIAAADFPEDGKFAATLGGWQVLVAKLDDGFHAINDRCPHAASPLSTGRIRRGTVMCPLHGARFDLASGTCIGGTYPALMSFPIRISDGTIEVAVPDRAPGMDEMAIRIG